jgi:hypothetical protein
MALFTSAMPGWDTKGNNDDQDAGYLADLQKYFSILHLN